ncbi:MAG: J domain-containing protein [Deltaproteobacteria bacterium]|nr:J domain-containing protein [Deltaproteobacteria bacterium]MDQ3301581.1 J domain-containing protein [Myxococcota bacterium]
MASGRTLHVRFTTWEQVEAFHTRKLRRGKLLSMKVAFQAAIGAQVTLGLELPNGIVIAIDGTVLKTSPIAGDTKTWTEIELVGFTEDVLSRIKAMANSGETAPAPAPAPAPPPPPAAPRPRAPSIPPDISGDERQLFLNLTTELRRMRQLAVHEVLDVPRDADADAVRHGWMTLVRHHHPDLVARYQAPAISHLAEEITILGNRAYDRLRSALVAEGRATSVGSVVQEPAGWLVGFEDLSSVDGSSLRPNAKSRPGFATPTPPTGIPAADAAAPSAPGGVQGGEAFELRARAMLGDGDANNAQEVLAAALCVYPRSRPLRSLYYVASAVSALQKGEVMLATSQLETALAHHESCREAGTILEHVRKHGHARIDEMRKLFK